MTWLLSWTLLLVQAQGAPQSPPPTPDAPRAALEGTVVRLGAGTPLRGADVTLQSVEASTVLSAVTDAAGRFVLTGIAPGAHRLSVDRQGYVSVEYGQRAPDTPGTPLVLAAGETRDDVVVAMTPTGAITGRIQDAFGEPAVNARVQALRFGYRDGQRVLFGAGATALTNDLGEYRLFWLEPGEYAVSVTPSSPARAGVFAIPDGVVTFGSTGIRVRVQSRVSRGAVPPPPAPPPPPPPPGERAAPFGFPGVVPLYYPGTTDPGSAALIELGPGIDYPGVDMRLVETPTVTVRGRVVAGAGVDVRNAAVRLARRETVGVGNPSFGMASVDDDGVFEIVGVVPGSYDLTAVLRDSASNFIYRGGDGIGEPAVAIALEGVISAIRDGIGREAGVGDGFGIDAESGAEPLFARMPIEIGFADVDGVTLTLAPGYDLQGRFLDDGADLDLSAARVELQGRRVAYGIPVPPARQGEDQTFTFENLPPSDYIVRVNGLPENAYVVEARLGSTDVLNGGLDLISEPSGRLDIRVAATGGRLDVAVVDAAGDPADGRRVVLIPNPPRRQRFDLYRAAVSDDSGVLRFTGVAPGDYKVFAWERVDTDAWQDADFIRIYENQGATVRVEPLGFQNATVRVIPD